MAAPGRPLPFSRGPGRLPAAVLPLVRLLPPGRAVQGLAVGQLCLILTGARADAMNIGDLGELVHGRTRPRLLGGAGAVLMDQGLRAQVVVGGSLAGKGRPGQAGPAHLAGVVGVPPTLPGTLSGPARLLAVLQCQPGPTGQPVFVGLVIEPPVLLGSGAAS